MVRSAPQALSSRAREAGPVGEIRVLDESSASTKSAALTLLPAMSSAGSGSSRLAAEGVIHLEIVRLASVDSRNRRSGLLRGPNASRAWLSRAYGLSCTLNMF
jgi:hypothetical protein